MIAGDVLETVGRTPLVRLRRLPQPRWAAVLGKLESRNPSGSVKDRVVAAILRDAEERGVLKPGDTVVEASAGNTGIALALLAAAKGYHAVITLPEGASQERQRFLLHLGAELRQSEGAKGMTGALELARHLAETQGYFHLGQFTNPVAARVHRETTAREILEATEGKVDAFVAGVGTGATITGVGEALKEAAPTALVVAVEPLRSPLLTRGRAGEHGVPGLGPDFLPPILNRKVIDDVILVSDEDAARITRRLIEEEGLLVGLSSGANTYGALRVAQRLGAGKTVVTVWPDSGERYVSLPR
jgi:cysteine synthase A